MTAASPAVSHTRALECLLPLNKRAEVTMVDGEGGWLIDQDGRRYLDFSAGVAVNALGHRHPKVVAAACRQIESIWHTSNHYWTEPLMGLADRLSTRFGGGQAFLCNSGAEANEAAIKYARKKTGRPGIVALEGSFHGRTMGALSITGQSAKRDPFAPLLPGVTFVLPNEPAKLEAAITDETGLVILEPILGEGGIKPLDRGFIEAASRLAKAHGALLCFDAIQTGVGRTGTFFGYETSGIRPDMTTLAKGLANGLPIGALIVANEAGCPVPEEAKQEQETDNRQDHPQVISPVTLFRLKADWAFALAWRPLARSTSRPTGRIIARTTPTTGGRASGRSRSRTA